MSKAVFNANVFCEGEVQTTKLIYLIESLRCLVVGETISKRPKITEIYFVLMYQLLL